MNTSIMIYRSFDRKGYAYKYDAVTEELLKNLKKLNYFSIKIKPIYPVYIPEQQEIYDELDIDEDKLDKIIEIQCFYHQYQKFIEGIKTLKEMKITEYAYPEEEFLFIYVPHNPDRESQVHIHVVVNKKFGFEAKKILGQ